jgi:hypothetical protein
VYEKIERDFCSNGIWIKDVNKNSNKVDDDDDDANRKKTVEYACLCVSV